MKTFKALNEELYIEGHEEYLGDDMTQKELKIAIYSAKNILEMLQDGEMIQRWQISAIVKASDELASVYSSMSVDMDDDMDDDMDYEYEDEYYQDEPMYGQYGYNMYGEDKETHKTKDGKTAKKGLWYNINQRKKKGLVPKEKGDEGYPETLDIDEAIEVSTSRYMKTHGKAPRDSGGSGTYMFTAKKTGEVDINNKKEVHQAYGTFAGAKQSAKKWAKENGYDSVYVLENKL
jgi:hypothetical protein